MYVFMFYMIGYYIRWGLVFVYINNIYVYNFS